MKIVIISDTHGYHRELKIPRGDMLIHAGDFCNHGTEAEARDFLSWLDALNFRYKIFIAGNHDSFAARYPHKFEGMIPDDIFYLRDSGAEIAGLKIWGSPVQPDLEGWAFGKSRGAAMKWHWSLIPENTDILITHTPPKGILDCNSRGQSLGCEELRTRLKSLHLKLHIFGHMHASYGHRQINDTLFINASNYNSREGLVNHAVSLQISDNKVSI